MKKLFKIFTLTFIVLLMVTSAAFAGGPGEKGNSPDDKGFDDCGYNDQANIYVGDADCVDRTEDGTVWGDPTYANDHLVMKWNEEWNRGKEEGWSDPDGYDAAENNHWNGKGENGSGETWHYQIDYSQACAEGQTLDDGGYCIWGSFEVTQSHGTTADNDHEWDANAEAGGSGVDH